MSPYADTNFFTKLYLRLPDSERAEALMTSMVGKLRLPLPVTWLHRLEIVNALELHVFGGQNPGQSRVTSQQAAIAQAGFRGDLRRPDFLRPIPLNHGMLENTCEDISLRHTARRGFRIYDVIHVASAVLLQCDTFWSFDVKACRLAALEGLKVELR